MNDSNRVIVDAWNTVLYEKFCRFRHLLVEGLSQHSETAFDRCRYPEGARALCAAGRHMGAVEHLVHYRV